MQSSPNRGINPRYIHMYLCVLQRHIIYMTETFRKESKWPYSKISSDAGEGEAELSVFQVS